MNGGEADGLIQRTIQRFLTAWRDISSSAPDDGMLRLRAGLPDADAERVRRQMQACLEGRGGEVSARARAAALGRGYLSLDPAGRRRFLAILANEFDTDRENINAAVADLHEIDDWVGRKRQERQLREALDPPRRRLLTQFNALPEGVKFLVDMRAELMASSGDDAALASLEADLKELLASWFDVGFLELARITWDSPAAILEKLIAYEAVHEIRGWDDLKNRLASDRRCYAFFHPRMPEEPLIFVEVALTDGLADDIQALLDETAPAVEPDRADTAVFYSISNAQRGLDGIGFGGFLIKRVVDELAADLRGLKTFATLSPIPGFRRWLDGRIDDAGEDALLTSGERRALAALLPDAPAGSLLRSATARPGWHRDEALAVGLARPLLRLCARYLTEAEPGERRVADPVAHFHLSNGARIERIDWLADVSAKGLELSAGMMVNYLYRTDEIAANHEAYSGEGKVPAAAGVRALRR